MGKNFETRMSIFLDKEGRVGRFVQSIPHNALSRYLNLILTAELHILDDNESYDLQLVSP